MANNFEKLAELAGLSREYRQKTAAQSKIAASFLRAPTGHSATVLLMSLRALCGEGVLSWEPESIWLTLERDHQIDLDEIARNKVQSAVTLIVNPSFYWDNLVFQRTTQALNGVLFDPETLQECHPAHMNWAVYEAGVIRGHDPEDPDAVVTSLLDIDEDVQQYIAVCLFRAGYTHPSEKLLAAEGNLLAMLPPESTAFAADVKNRWRHLRKTGLSERVFPETPVGVQLAQLASCFVYFSEQAQILAEDVLVFKKEISF